VSGNIEWRLRARPHGEVTREDFDIRSAARPVPGAGEALVRNIYLFVPPSMRLWMDEKESYLPPQPLGEVMTGITLGVVEASNDSSLPVGTYVNGMGGCQQWYVAPAARLLPVAAHPGLPLAAYRTVLDVQGLTAYCGLIEICQPKAGETLVVTAAAGSVGSLVCQIGKQLGLRVVGVAGGREKCDWLVDACGVDAAIDYKAGDVGQRLDKACPGGIDMLFENVGGPVMDLALDRINRRARVALCGLVSSYNGGGMQRTSALMQLVNKSARIEGFLLTDYIDRYAAVVKQLEAWILDGSIRYQIDILDGLDNLPEAMSKVFHGRNRGAQLLRLSEEGRA
jgi:NADPH-dependent curcumin reductase CurA